ncbi:hypothetical protein [Niveispirillum irakense]|uniref:hypothetical protein n=1 Tax=Niveispirillum irakense TaxID=34011 RepID=UPI0003FC9DF5|nr:hypothetical protein [Niveispirillum irakense]
MSRGALLIIACLVGLLALAITLAVIAWNAMDAPLNISLHGFIALGLGAVGSLAVGGGLMALVFFSNRSGHDQAVHEENSRTLGEPPEDD